MKKHTLEQGLTLVELLITLAIVSLMIGVAITPLTDVMHRSKATAAVNWLVGSIVFTRHAAIVYRVTVTLCPSDSGNECGGKQWQQGIIAFTDYNQDRRINGKDRLLKRFDSPGAEMSISWRSFRNRQYLQMLPSGLTNYQNGNFVYCPDDGNLRFARQIVLNMPGRVRHSRDTNGDGMVEDLRGKHLRC